MHFLQPLCAKLARCSMVSLAVLVTSSTLLAQQPIILQKHTNGLDADTAPGPFITIGDPVTWTYEVTDNTGGRGLENIVVTDDQGVSVSCPSSTLGGGESMTCNGSGTAVAGQYANIGTVNADVVGGGSVSGNDSSHYFGVESQAIDIEKATNGQDADNPPGPVLDPNEPVFWTYLVTNIGNATLTNIAVSDDQLVAVTCPSSTLGPGEAMTCTGFGKAASGQYSNTGVVTALLPNGEQVSDDDLSHYRGRRLDFGDAPDPTYPTLLANDGARHLLGGRLHLGACVDAEADGQPTSAASGDDSATSVETYGDCATDGDDEDGVRFVSPMVAGGNASIEITASEAGLLSAWNDFNGDGDWADAGEQIFADVALAAGLNALVFAVPAGAVSGQGYARFRVASGSGLPPTGSAPDGEVEDYPVVVGPAEDLGDAPDPTYPTLRASDGARHTLGSDVYLGACVDAELDGQPSANADGDDQTPGQPVIGRCGPGGDADGVSFITPLLSGAEAQLEVVANAACTLSAWVDFNQDGDWDDAGESLFPGGAALVVGTNALPVAVPAGATIGQSYARFRCTSDGVVAVTGMASDGEVEDYQVQIEACGNSTVDLGEDCDEGDANGSASSCCTSGCEFKSDGESCSDGRFCSVGDSCNDQGQCSGRSRSCSDGVGCTIDSCNEGRSTCEHAPDHSACGSTLFCDGGGLCDPFQGCIAGAGPVCDDGLACTVDSCDEASQSCGNTPDHGLCDDGLFCNGAETCDGSLGCQPGARTCDDGVACTVDTCDEAAQTCENLPDHSACDDGDACNGAETCDPVLGCQSGVASCDDGVACTVDSCDPLSGACSHSPDHGLCDDGLFCNGIESCDPLAGCQPGADPCDDGLACTADSCDEATGACDHLAEDALCDDGLFCTGLEYCDPQLGCQAGAEPCIDGDACNDQCNELSGTCYAPEGTACGDSFGSACDYSDSCDGAGSCQDNLIADGTPCRDNLDFCDGVETCQAGLCVSSGDPCAGEQTCNEETDDCGSGAACPTGSCDAGALVGADGGDGGAGPGGGGCDCSAGASGAPAPGIGVLAAGLLLGWRRRRR